MEKELASRRETLPWLAEFFDLGFDPSLAPVLHRLLSECNFLSESLSTVFPVLLATCSRLEFPTFSN
jgi:hypothetical protein